MLSLRQVVNPPPIGPHLAFRLTHAPLLRAILFVALTDVRDGHDFVAQALRKGAAAALVTHRPEGVDADAPLLIVENVLHALDSLGPRGPRPHQSPCCRDYWIGGQNVDQGNAPRGLAAAR